MRKLATIRKVAEVKPIPGATAIEAIRVDGWWVVDSINKYKVGDFVVYLEPDSWVPHHLAPFLSKGEPREYQGVKGERLRTIKLRGQLSQGLILPTSCVTQDNVDGKEYPFIESSDVTELLGILKWEKPVPVQLQGQMKGNFPTFIRKTDQERIQNKLEVLESPYLWQVTTKLDGSSMTVYWKDNQMGVCSRNVDLKLDQVGNTFVDTAKDVFGFRIFEGLAIQGELMGPGIQGNRENLTEHQFFVFDIWDINAQCYLSPQETFEFCQEHKLNHVPVINKAIGLTDLTLEKLLEAADNTHSLNNPIAEGLVFKQLDGKDSFKVISNKFLLKEG